MARGRRKTGKSVKASVLVDVELHARWGYCASLRGQDRSAFAVRAIEEACRGVVLIDRRNPKGQGKAIDRPIEADDVKSADRDSAA